MLRVKENSPEYEKKKVLKLITKRLQPKGSGRALGVCMQINGEWSCGKTLFLAFIAVERNILREGLPIVSNLSLKGVYPYYRLTDNVEILSKVRGSIIMIDEIRRYMDSYLTFAKKTRFIANITSDFGKFSNDFYYTDQSPTAAPTRVRNNISLVVYPKIDESNNWVTVYCFHGVTEYLMVEPFSYFGFYAPDYWWVYETEQKIHDYKFRFPVKRYSYNFIAWLRKHGYGNKMNGRMINLWNLDRGLSLTGSEQSAILTFLEEEFDRR